MKKTDALIIISALIFAAAAFFISKNQPADTAYIYKDGELYISCPLSENRIIDVDGSNTVTIEDGYVYMSYADCPDKLCIKQGKISDRSASIVCLPNKVTVTTTRNDGIDAVSG